MPAPPLAAAANTPLVDALLEFLEAFIHQVLFVREIYSPELFERQRLYGIAVRRARHPELAAYIASAVAGLRGPLASGSLAKVAIVVLGPQHQPVERFVFEPRLTSAEPGGPAELDLEALESHLRSALLKVQYCDSYLRKLPSSCTFEVVAYTSGRRGPGGVANDEWVEEQPAPGRLELAQAELIPIKSCALEGAFQLQLYAES
ncbi:hypothetical protein ABPG77_005591 [Micractinium sp. CCAP 211/92]